MAFEAEDDLISELRNWFDNLDVDFFRVIADHTEHQHNEDRCGMPNYKYVMLIGEETRGDETEIVVEDEQSSQGHESARSKITTTC
ncbi:hypothetical protein PoB_000761400 [Plakobranchus ocellatus]|uniref:Uncharacterized protein n=1 Tax=Plakobranchus ocellatus TaxID=259542 RepID=A0AAV3YFM8_9GAST|nr:hypothetical protein PoB_000761400 [Plakobranchus ocellatus]